MTADRIRACIFFGWWYVGLRVLKLLVTDPMSILPAIGILLASAALIWLGVVTLWPLFSN